MAASETLDPPAATRLEFMLAELTRLVYSRTRQRGEPMMHREDFMPQWGPPDQDALVAKMKATFGLVDELKGAKRGNG